MLCSPLKSIDAKKAGLFTIVRTPISISIQAWIRLRIRTALTVRAWAQTLPGALTRFNSHSYPNWRLIVVTCVILGAQACSREGLDPELETYTYRLADILGTEHHPIAQPPVFIDRRARAIAINALRADQSTLDLLDYLSMRGCKLQQVVSERNNQLGRLADPITVLFFDLRFIAFAPDCITALRSEDPPTAQLLSEALASKLAKRNAHIEQAVLLSDEMMAFWKHSTFTQITPQSTLAEVMALNALSQQVIQLKRGELLEVSTIYDSLQPLNSGLGGKLLGGWLSLSEHLKEAEHHLDQFIERRPLCFNEQSNARADRLEGLVTRRFATSVQLEFNRLEQATRKVMPAVAELERSLATGQTSTLTAFQAERDQLIDKTRALLVSHVQRLGDTLGTCGLRPGYRSYPSAEPNSRGSFTPQ
jgi:hypothetical protein